MNAAFAVSAHPLVPQKQALDLFSTGDARAIASWGRWRIEGRWVWCWEEFIDRRFVRRYASTDCNAAAIDAR